MILSTRKASLIAYLMVVSAVLAQAGCGKKVTEPPPAATAEEAIMRVTKGLQENKPVAIWHALPASYQKDVHDLIHTAIGRLDAEAYESTIKFARRLHTILNTKKQFIVNHPTVSGFLGKGNAEQIVGSLEVILGELLDSDLASHSSAKAIDMAYFLDTTGARIMGRLMNAIENVPMMGVDAEYMSLADSLKQVKATKVRGEGDSVVLKMEAPGKEPEEMEFVRVEGKWIPKEMADDWAANMKEAKESLAAMTDKEWREINMGLMMGSAMLGGMLAPLESAKTQEEFNAAVGTLLQGLPFPGLDGGPEPSTTDDDPPAKTESDGSPKQLD